MAAFVICQSNSPAPFPVQLLYKGLNDKVVLKKLPRVFSSARFFIQSAVMNVLGWESEFLESILLLPPISQPTPLTGE